MKIATFNFGKTNSKLLVFDEDGTIIHQVRTKPRWHMQDGFRVLERSSLAGWAEYEIEQAYVRHGTDGVMGGREFAILSGDWQGPVDRQAVQRVIDQKLFVLPGFAAAGPFGKRPGTMPEGLAGSAERAALALLYVALLADFSLDLIRSDNQIVVDGGLTLGGVLTEIIAQLRPGQSVWEGTNPEGTAAGAAALVFEARGVTLPLLSPRCVTPHGYHGLLAYRDAWRARIPLLDAAAPMVAGSAA